MIIRTKRLFGVVSIYTACVITFIMVQWVRHIQDQGDFLLSRNTATVDMNHTTHEPKTIYKRILYWNPYFKSEDFRFGYGHEPFIEHECAVNTCEATDNKLAIAEVDAVLVHTPLVDKMPPRPLRHQRFVMVQDEPHMSNSRILMSAMADYFNLTMSYRKDSDMVIYYAHEKRNVAFSELVDVDPKERPRSVVWVASHCETPSNRELYVSELMKYIDVDVYGKCGSYSCPKKNNTYCRDMYERTYRFYLSFENDICNDYVSEKLYHPLKYKIIPIVYGGVDYAERSPHNSVINIKDYPNPKDLATHLHYLAEDRDAYNEHFKWKRSGIRFDLNPYQRMARGICRLCEILHDKKYVYKDYRDIKTWWLGKSCNKSAMKKMMRTWSKSIVEK